ncbi:MAG: helix-turn-helix domain-containing protein [Wujia sp.]
MYEDLFSARLAQLRVNKGVSARDMSLSIGLNAGYINNIENGKTLPSMTVFFYICEYLNIEPKEFFDFDSNNPVELQELFDKMKLLDSKQMEAISTLIDGLIDQKGKS